MRPCAGIEEYFADPVGRYFSGRTFVHFYLDRGLDGVLLWGRPDEQDARQLIRVLDVEVLPHARPEASIVDVRRLEGVDAAAFAIVAAFLKDRWQRVGPMAKRQAVIRAEGLPGAVAAGFFAVTPPLTEWRVFSNTADGLRWLGHPNGELLLHEIEELEAIALGTPHVLRELRERLAARPAGARLDDASRALGMSERSLQRRLREMGTSFRAEVNAARVKAAQALLLDTDAKLTAVALEVGCSSLQHFSGLFRRLTGESPRAWRARRRQEPA